MSLAQAAFLAARDSGAEEKSPTLFRKAEVYYLKAKSAYKKKFFDKAKQYALLSKKYSEKAEYDAIRLKVLENE
jgi:hypothetical protein